MRELPPSAIAPSEYVRTLLNCGLPSLEKTSGDSEERVLRKLRKLMLYWTLLTEVGFEHDGQRLESQLIEFGYKSGFCPMLPQPLRLAAYQAVAGSAPPVQPRTFEQMTVEMKILTKFAI